VESATPTGNPEIACNTIEKSNKNGHFSRVEKSHPSPGERVRLWLVDEAPAIGCGVRIITIHQVSPECVWISVPVLGAVAKLTWQQFKRCRPQPVKTPLPVLAAPALVPTLGPAAATASA